MFNINIDLCTILICTECALVRIRYYLRNSMRDNFRHLAICTRARICSFVLSVYRYARIAKESRIWDSIGVFHMALTMLTGINLSFFNIL